MSIVERHTGVHLVDTLPPGQVRRHGVPADRLLGRPTPAWLPRDALALGLLSDPHVAPANRIRAAALGDAHQNTGKVAKRLCTGLQSL